MGIMWESNGYLAYDGASSEVWGHLSKVFHCGNKIKEYIVRNETKMEFHGYHVGI